MTILKWLIAVNEQLFIANEILAEVVYVLLGVYEISKIDIADKLINLISHVGWVSPTFFGLI